MNSLKDQLCIKCGLSHDPDDPAAAMVRFDLNPNYTEMAEEDQLVFVHERCLMAYRKDQATSELFAFQILLKDLHPDDPKQ